MPDEHTPETGPPRAPLLTPQTSSLALCPNDHLRLLAELLRPETVPAVRRWVAALMMVDEADRPGVVESVEARIVARYGAERGSMPSPIAPATEVEAKPEPGVARDINSGGKQRATRKGAR